METRPLDVVRTHDDVPLTDVANPNDFQPVSDPGVSKYRAKLPRDATMDALLLNQGSDVLVVALHGASVRTKSLPRFEWFRTLRKTEYSSLYISDPTLHLAPDISLAWYTGWLEYDLHPLIAEWAVRAASAVGASRILFLGSSGGGFASLQIAPLIPGSMALPFQPQTSIANYLVSGTSLSAQRTYLRVVMPHLTPPEGLRSLRVGVDYFEPLGERVSPLMRYQAEQQNYVYYAQNANDKAHYDQHYLPFREVIENGPNRERVRFELQDGPSGHNPPRPHFFMSALENSVEWLRQTGGRHVRDSAGPVPASLE